VSSDFKAAPTLAATRGDPLPVRRRPGRAQADEAVTMPKLRRCPRRGKAPAKSDTSRGSVQELRTRV
jgi:hypothetical protein